ncbi:MAG TPA: LuxR C-terminal-related transcriptional regulator [Symbiobacteriaceae bacterium]|nr:LuxR C-terminal-related transcriptional regulator [Symbiobacteriaceae bacterium]
MAATIPDSSAWLVATKLRPPLMRDDTIRRTHLEEALSRSVSALPLTLLSAPAGYGKTTMLASLPRLLPELPLAWVTLDAEDNDPIRFLSLLATACQRLHPECGKSVWPWLAAGATEGAGLKRAVGALINDILACLPSPFILVLDDLHFVTEPAVFVALEYLLDHQPPQLHLAVGTRHDPPLRLTRMAARRQLAELRRPDLSFSENEAHELLNATLGLSLSETEVTALQQRTEGWPAGLCLLAGPLARMGTQADRSQFMAAVTHSERYALDFLAEEVLRNLPDDLRRFLMQTSILAEMTPSACRAVTGREDAEDVLEGLYRQNLTIASITTGEDGEPVYRHHALFARLLSRQLEREMPGELTDLHRRAAAAQKTPGRAIAHFFAAGLWEEAAQLMGKFGMQLLHSGMAETVRTWYGALPAETRTANPRLTVLVARCHIHRGEYATARGLLAPALEIFVANGDTEGEMDAVTSLITVSYAMDDVAAVAECVERALRLPLGPMGQVAARLARAWLHFLHSEWGDCHDDIRDALTVAITSGDRRTDMIAIPYMAASLIAVPGCLDLTERYCAEVVGRTQPETAWRLGAEELAIWPVLMHGRMDDALARAEATNALRQRLGGYPFMGVELAVHLTVLQIARGDLAAAAQSLETLQHRTEGGGRGRWNFYFHAAGRALALLGRIPEADATLQRLVALESDLPLVRYLKEHLAGLIALLDGRRPEAAAALDRAAGLEAELPIAWIGGSARLLQARLLLDKGRPEEALAAAAPVLEAWDKAGTPGRALLDGPAILPVLRLAAQRGSDIATRALRLFATPAAAPVNAAPVAPAPAGGALAEPLTQRELDVLKLIVAGRTNRQIGEELYITEETVKTHVVRILRKLDVTSRTQAAIRGRELGL